MATPRHISLGNLKIGNDLPFTLIAGPCQMESRDHAIETASLLKGMCDQLGLGLIYKTSFVKQNRTSVNAPSGLGMETALKVFEEIKTTLSIPVLTDVHSADQCAPVAEVVDVLQIPAFLCRQTDLLIAAGSTGRVINVKKGQFLAPWEMENVAKKLSSTGNDNIMLCDRGTSFGYNTLITDIRGLPIMAKTGYPIVFDATHSTQQPGGQGETSGGQREFAPVLARAALSVGVAAVFMETHEDPDNAPCDGPNMIYLDQMPALLETLQKFDQLAKAHPITI